MLETFVNPGIDIQCIHLARSGKKKHSGHYYVKITNHRS